MGLPIATHMSPDQMPHTGNMSFAAVALALTAPAAIHPALAATPCDSVGELFLETEANLKGTDGSVTFDLAGAIGQQFFTFASGLDQSTIIATINTFLEATGVAAEQSTVNTDRVRLFSALTGDDAFVSATQIGGNAPLLYAGAVDGQPLWRFIAHGEDGVVGDANCDARVDLGDLMSVVDHWGACPKLPSPCVGDVDLSGAVDVDDLIAVIMNWT
jgi:hypothetical protein